ncbi:MAG TPA: iron ABC transporter permease [Saprospiraceae bacterium]|nr:iron ABC transporter permease [Saprospiraceae bacterium]
MHAGKPLSSSEIYRRSLRKKRLFVWVALALVLVLLLFGLTAGALKLSFAEVWAALFGGQNDTHRHIVLNLRLPRLLAAIVAGGALGLAGAVMQIVLRNPLGSPFTLGISNAAAFGAALAYLMLGSPILQSVHHWLPGVQNSIVAISAFIWAALGSFFIIFISRKKGATPENMILSGIIINTFFMALTSILQFLADDVQLGSIVFWTFGDLAKSTWNTLAIQVLVILPVLLFFLKNGLRFNALDAGDQVASSLGISVHKFRLYSILLTSLLTACIVSFYGIIAFVGLIIPHVVRILMGNDARFLMPASAALGALFLLICDLVSRSLFSPLVIPVGIITSIIGAPLFVILLIKGSQRWSR